MISAIGHNILFIFFFKFSRKQEPKTILDQLYYLISTHRANVVLKNKQYEIKLIHAESTQMGIPACSKYYEHRPLFFGIDINLLHTVYHGQLWIEDCLNNIKNDKYLPEHQVFFKSNNIDKNLWRRRLENSVSSFNSNRQIKTYEEFLNIPVVPLSGDAYTKWQTNKIISFVKLIFIFLLFFVYFSFCFVFKFFLFF
jgi:hypothetical protein